MGCGARRGRVWLEGCQAPAGLFGVQAALRALERASHLSQGAVCVLALPAAMVHAEERSRDPGTPGVFYVTVISDAAGGRVESGAAVAAWGSARMGVARPATFGSAAVKASPAGLSVR